MCRGIRTAIGVLLCSAILGGCTRGAEPEVDATVSPAISVAPSPSGPQSLSEAIDYVSGGVFRIETTACDSLGPGSGTGFRVGEDLVATVAHVIAGARTLSIRSAEGVVRGEVVGVDPDREVALLRAAKPITGHVFEFATASPELSAEVAALGYPQGLQFTPALGHVTGLDRRVEMDDRSMTGLIQTDADIYPGNSGGPLIDDRGLVVGLVEARRLQRTAMGDYVGAADLGYAVPAGVAADLVSGWSQTPVTERLADCPDPAGDYVTVESIHPDAPAVALAFRNYVEAINDGDYAAAWYGLITGDLRQSFGGFEGFVEQYSTTTITGFVLETVSRRDETRNTADVRFVSEQSSDHGFEGQICSQWHLRYTMRVDSGQWRIDSAKDLQGGPVACSPAPTPSSTPSTPQSETAMPSASAL